MSLRWFHMWFLLIVILGADFFGGWAIHVYRQTGDVFTLVMGIVTVVVGLGLAGYVAWLVRKLDAAHIA
jgi:hypothetical protein